MARRVKKPKLAVDRRAYTHQHGQSNKKVIVLHTTESGDSKGTGDIESVLRYLESRDYGVHFCVDKQGLVGQGARLNDIVWHAKGANTLGIGIEQIGYSSFTLRQWWLRRKQLVRVAHLLAWISQVEGIPLVHSTTHGVAQHKDFPAGGHGDCGSGYPFRYVMRLARRYKRLGYSPK